MEAVLSFRGCNTKLLDHDCLARVVWQLQIICTSHNTWKVIIRVHLGCIERLLDNSKRRTERFERSNGQPRTSGDKLKESPLFLLIVPGKNLKQINDRCALQRETMGGAEGFERSNGQPRTS